MMTPIAVSLATSTAARMAAVDALALLAAIVVAVSVVGLLGASALFPSIARPYRLVTDAPPSTGRLTEEQDIQAAA